MDKIILLIEEYVCDGNVDFKVTPFRDWDKAKDEFQKAAQSDMDEYPDTVQVATDTHYENYEDGDYNECHSVIYLTEKEVR